MTKVRNRMGVRCIGIGRPFAFLWLVCLAVGCRRAPEAPLVLTGEAQGTYYSVSYYDTQHRNLQPQIDSLLDEFDLSASLWVEESLLRRLNANQTDSVDALLADLLLLSQQMSEYTDGAFDCRVGRMVQMWGFSFRQRQEPDSAELAALLAAAHCNVSLSDGHLIKEDTTTELDFNAIAQGYAVDLLAAMLDGLGIENYLIDVGGEVRGRGGKADGSPWRVGIERPAADRYSSPVVESVIALHDASVVTSGSYRKYYERDGVRYSHTIDPTTGRPVQHSLLSVSVVEKQAWLADAMATAYMVMGLDSARAFIQAHKGGPGTGAVMFIYDDGDGNLCTDATPKFDELIIQNRHHI